MNKEAMYAKRIIKISIHEDEDVITELFTLCLSMMRLKKTSFQPLTLKVS
jgi:hypothetical protein